MINLLQAKLLRGLLFSILVVVASVGITFISYNLGLSKHFAYGDLLRPVELQRVMVDFQDLEYSEGYAFFWTQGDSKICLENLGRVSQSVVSIMLLGKGANALGHQEARLFINDQLVTTLPIIPAARRYDLLLGPQLSSQDDHCFRITSDITVLPSHSRALGVPFVNLKLYPSSEALVIPAWHQIVMNGLIALVVFWLLRGFGLPAWAALVAILGAAAFLLSLLGLGVLNVGVAVNRMLPPVLGGLAVASAGLGTVRWLNQQPWFADRDHDGRLLRDLLGMLFWSVLLWGGLEVVQFYSGHRAGVWPLKAQLYPAYTPWVVLPVVLFGLWVSMVLVQLRRLEPALAQQQALWRLVAPTLALILVGALLLPVVLKGPVRGWDSLYTTFANEYDYQYDVPRFDDPLTILRDYVALSPTLSHHNSNHPPGSLLLLWGVVQLAGPGVVVTSWLAIMLGCLAVIAAIWLGWRLGGPMLGLLAGALMTVMPGHQIYNVTSMDALFSALIALGAVSFLLALEPGAGVVRAMLSGALIALALFFTYTTTQLFFFGVVTFVFAVVRAYPRGSGWKQLGQALLLPLRQALISAATIIVIYVILYWATGFHLLEAIRRASALNSIAMHGIDTSMRPFSFLPPSLAAYTDFLAPNLLPYLWYLAPWGLTALSAVLLGRIFQHQKFELVDSIVFGLAGVVAGMWLSGLFLREVERVWAFTYPLAAVLIAYHVWQGPSLHVRLWRAGLFLTLFSLQVVLMRVWLYTFW
jgi:hypothetical protein